MDINKLNFYKNSICDFNTTNLKKFVMPEKDTIILSKSEKRNNNTSSQHKSIKDMFQLAIFSIRNNNISEFVNYLKSIGFSTEEITKYLSDFEKQKVNAIFKSTADINKAINYANNSQLLTKNDIQNLTTGLKISALGNENNSSIIEKYKGFDFSTLQGCLISMDIDMLYNSQQKGIDIKELMVPTIFSNEDLLNLDIGDVFVLDDSDKLCIKEENGNYKELNLSKNTYCKLFPPVERYSAGQQYSPDCYLVSGLNTMMTNKYTRVNLLECFSENKNGDVTVKLPHSKIEVTLKNGQNITDITTCDKYRVDSAVGIQLLEYAYKADKAYNNFDEFYKKLDMATFEYCWQRVYKKEYPNFSEFKKKYELINNSIYTEIQEKLGKSISKKEFKDLINKIEFSFRKSENNIIMNENELCEFLNIPNEDFNKIRNILSSIGADNKKILSIYQDEYFLPFDKKEIVLEYAELYETGGNTSEVYSRFGLNNFLGINTTDFNIGYEYVKKNIGNEKMLLSCGSKYTKDTYLEYINKFGGTFNQDKYDLLPDTLSNGVVGGHAYSFEIRRNLNNQIEIVIINPWSSTNSTNRCISLTEKEFFKCFDSIYIGTKN